MATSKLKSIFNDVFFPNEEITSQDPEYFETYKKISEKKKYFIGKMSLDDAARFEELENLYLQADSIYNSECFVYGFRLGVKLMAEVFIGET